MNLKELIREELKNKDIKIKIEDRSSKARFKNHFRRLIINLIPDTREGFKVKNKFFNFGYIGERCMIRNNLRYHHGTNIYLMDKVFINYDCLFLDSDLIYIGSNVNIGPHVNIYTIDHAVQNGKLTSIKSPVYIENNVWIGGNSTILSNVHIGEGSIIAAGSVVNKSLESYTLSAGVPARKIKDLRK